MPFTGMTPSHISPLCSAARPPAFPISFSLFNPSFLFRGPLCCSAPPHRLSRRISRSVVSCYLRKSSAFILHTASPASDSCSFFSFLILSSIISEFSLDESLVIDSFIFARSCVAASVVCHRLLCFIR